MMLPNLQAIEAKCTVRSCIKLPASLGPPPAIEDWGCLPSLEQLGLYSQNVSFAISILWESLQETLVFELNNDKIMSLALSVYFLLM